MKNDANESSKSNKQKNLDLDCTFFSVKNDANESSKSNKQKNLEKNVIFCWHLEIHLRKEQDTDPEPLVRGTNPRIRIQIRMRTKMSQNWNSLDICFSYLLCH